MTTLTDIKTALSAEEVEQNKVIQALGELASNAASEQADLDAVMASLASDTAALQAAEAAVAPTPVTVPAA